MWSVDAGTVVPVASPQFCPFEELVVRFLLQPSPTAQSTCVSKKSQNEIDSKIKNIIKLKNAKT